MISSITRSSASHSRPVSKYRHKSAHVHRSKTEVKQHTRRKSISKNDDSSHYSKTRSSTIKISERRREDDSSDSDEDGAMSTVSEESEWEREQKPKERKVKIIYVKSERPRSSRRSLREVASDEKTSKGEVKVTTKSLNRSATSSHRIRSQSAQDVRESKPVLKRSHSLSQSHLPTKSHHEPPMTNSKATSRRASFFGLFTPTIKEEKPPRL